MSTVREIVATVGKELGVRPIDILSHRRPADVVRARQIVMWLARQSTLLSLPQIGRQLDRDHTTVLHGIRQVEAARRLSDEERRRTDRMLAALEMETA